METKFTRGKWRVVHSESKPAFNVIGTVPGMKYKIARCPYHIYEGQSDLMADREKEEAEANAKLISCAPEMLEALQWFVDRCDNAEVRSTRTYNRFKEIIKKATE